MLRGIALGCLLLAPLPALAEDWDFDRAVRGVERDLGGRRLKIPLFGLISAIAYPVYRPMGVKNFKMVIFEDLERRREAAPAPRLELGPGWRPVVRVVERHGDTVNIYARDEGTWVRMILLTVDHDDAVLMQFKIRPSGLLTFVSKHARGERHGRGDR